MIFYTWLNLYDMKRFIIFINTVELSKFHINPTHCHFHFLRSSGSCFSNLLCCQNGFGFYSYSCFCFCFCSCSCFCFCSDSYSCPCSCSYFWTCSVTLICFSPGFCCETSTLTSILTLTQIWTPIGSSTVTSTVTLIATWTLTQ